jgi:phosphoribosylaminoimidazole-succinocarboxamide synthase
VIQTIRETQLDGLPLIHRGKVRDTFDLGDALLMVASDRLSAFDVVLPTAIPLKGAVLTQLSSFWFERTTQIVPNHLVSATVASFPETLQPFRRQLAGRAMIVKKARRIDYECVVRGYLAGSAWQEYRESRTIGGERMPEALVRAGQLPAPIFTPAVKRDDGHDINISRGDLANRIGADLATDLERISLDLYRTASDLALRRGIIVADTKFEFGFVDDVLTLIDEALTPDSSRFWDTATYDPGKDQPSFDKQYVRDWLIQSGWNKEPPAPELPADVVAGTARRYHAAFKRLTGRPLRIENGD